MPWPYLRTLVNFSYWMRDVAMSAFHDFSGTFSCWSVVSIGAKAFSYPFYGTGISGISPSCHQCVECLLPRGPSQPPMASCLLTTSSSSVSVPQCDQVLLGTIRASLPQPGCTPSLNGQGQLLIQIHLLTKYNFIYVCVYIKMEHIYL